MTRTMAKAVWRGCALGILIPGYLGHAVLLNRASRLKFMSRYSRIALWILGVQVDQVGTKVSGRRVRGTLWVANHLSYVDVLVLASIAPLRFVTSVEVAESFALGWIARLGESIFVERRRISSVANDARRIAAALEEGDSVVLFPEGTSSNGDAVLPFKSALFEAAARIGAEVQPVCLRYRDPNGAPVGRAVADRIFYYGDMGFFQQLGRLLTVESVRVSVTCLKPALHARRRELAAMAHRQISDAYRDVAEGAISER